MKPGTRHMVLAALLLCSASLMAVPPVKDTVVNGLKISYNFLSLDYCNSLKLDRSAVLSIGTINNDSTRTGTWYFFYPSGKLLAKGKYTDGYKTGIWTYYPKGKSASKVKWSKDHRVLTEIIFDKSNDPVIKDVMGNGLELFNGSSRNTYVWHNPYHTR